MLINIAVEPNECIDECPENTHESNGKCIKGEPYVQLRYESKFFNGENPDYINNAYPEIFDKINWPVNNKFSVNLWF
mgnify:FL=1